MPLTDIAIKKAKPSEKPYKLYDERGLYLEISPTGGKWWRIKYRHDGKEKRISLGTYPDVSLKDARDRRDAARKLLADGVDPSETRKAHKAAKAEDGENTFEAIAREWHTKQAPTLNARHSKDVIRRLERDIFPWIGTKPIRSLTPPALLSVLRRIEARSAHETAHRALGNCGQVFRFAVASGRADADITTSLHKALVPVVGNHFAATTDPQRFSEILRAMEGYKGSLIVRCALRLAPMVFVRPGELRKAEWSQFNLAAGEWRYIVSKTKTDHIVPLSKQAVQVLKELWPLTGGGNYVFPSARTATKPMSDNAVLAAMRNLGIGKEEMTGHGFRAVARTILDEILKWPPHIIEHQLAHAVRDPNGRAYNRTAHLEDRRKMMQEWSDHLDALKAVKAPIPLQSKSKAKTKAQAQAQA